ncbi:MAG: dynamin family protein [Candidatus Cloacimonetes bacterium]|nr:dynamin family protein [Candidatus Cloacimonadota bacterium]
MSNINANKIIRILNSLNLEITPLLENLNASRKSALYLAGKSGSGKTAILNALLEHEDEFFTSTKVSTQTQFRISYGDNFAYKSSEESFIEFSDDIEERKEKLKKLNMLGVEICIHCPASILKQMDIVDIPGFFDFNNINKFKAKLADEADIVLFLKTYNEMLTPAEKEFLDLLTEKHIQYCILFTKIDIVNRIEGLTAQTIPGFIEVRIGDYGKYKHYFLTSKNQPETITVLKNYLERNSVSIYEESKKSKLERVRNHYIDEIKSWKLELTKEIEAKINNEKDLFDRNNEKTRRNTINEFEYLKLTINDYKKSLYSDMQTVLESGSKEDLLKKWNRYWENSKESIQRKFPDFEDDFRIDLPSVDNEMFGKLITPNDLIKIINVNSNEDDSKDENESLITAIKQIFDKAETKDKNDNTNIINFLSQILSRVIKDDDLCNKVMDSITIKSKRSSWLKNTEIRVNNITDRTLESLKRSIEQKQPDFDIDNRKQELFDEKNIPELDRALAELKG